MSFHTSVLPSEIAQHFVGLEGVFLDCTLGFGGHTKIIAQNNPNLEFICIDKDKEAIKYCQENINLPNKISYINSSFANALQDLAGLKIAGLIADLGVSSYQIDQNNRGFSFDSDFLDMRMDTSKDFNAQILVNTYPRSKLIDLLKNGEEPSAVQITELIINTRKTQKITSAKELCQIIKTAKNTKNQRACALSFQAIRIEVNQELAELKSLLDNLLQLNTKNALVGIISFHSLEDRLVKQRFKQWSKNGDGFFVSQEKKGQIITKKPITPSLKEQKQNPRSKSSKLRIFKFD